MDAVLDSTLFSFFGTFSARSIKPGKNLQTDADVTYEPICALCQKNPDLVILGTGTVYFNIFVKICTTNINKLRVSIYIEIQHLSSALSWLEQRK